MGCYEPQLVRNEKKKIFSELKKTLRSSSTEPLLSLRLSVRIQLLRVWERVFVIGSEESLGEWIPQNAMHMERSGTDRLSIDKFSQADFRTRDLLGPRSKRLLQLVFR